MKVSNLAILSALTLAGTPALAADRSVTLAVENLSCVTCVPTVKKSLSQVKGVKRVNVSAKTKTATVTFDDKATNVAALVKATTNAGYPSRLRK